MRSLLLFDDKVKGFLMRVVTAMTGVPPIGHSFIVVVGDDDVFISIFSFWFFKT